MLHSFLSRKRTADEIQQVQYDRDSEAEQTSYSSRSTGAGMAPPPIPIDPAIRSWNSTTIPLSPRSTLESLAQSPSGSQNRLNFPGSTTLDNFPQELPLPSMKPNHMDLDPSPMLRWESDPQAPWTPQRIGGEASQLPMASKYSSFDGRSYNPVPYYRKPRSDIGSSTTRTYPVDSGYGGSRSLGPRSVRSLDQSQSGQSISGEMNDLHFQQDDTQWIESHLGPTVSPSSNFTYELNDASHQTPVNFEFTCQYPSCGLNLKNQSEFKYDFIIFIYRVTRVNWKLYQKTFAKAPQTFQMRAGRMHQDGRF